MKQILPWVSINGKILPREQAVISVFDYGFLYGYGIFTTLKVREGIPLFFEHHLSRLQTTLTDLSFPSNSFPFDLATEIERVIQKNNMTEGGIRVTVTYDVANALSILIHARTVEKEIIKVSVITIPDERDEYKRVKMTYRVPHMVGRKKAEEQGAQDAIFCKNNVLVESTYANIYSYTKDKKIITPPIEKRGLNGISRQILMRQLPVQEQEIHKDTDDPLLLVTTLSTRIVEKVDGRKIKQDETFIRTIQEAMNIAEKKYLRKYTPPVHTQNENPYHR